MLEDPIRALYLVMCGERVNVEFLFVELDDGTPVINCRLREWKRGNASERMILAAGRSLDEALVYAYKGLSEAIWLPIDWSARAYEVGVVSMLARPHLPVRPPLPFDSALRAINQRNVTEVPHPADNVPLSVSQRRNGKPSA